MPVILATQEADQENHNSKPAQAKSSQNPPLKKPNTKRRASRVAQGVGPECIPQYHQINK
jgi:hypothetical protein